MKKLLIQLTFLTFLGVLSTSSAVGQCDTIADVCSENFTKEYLSDGQEYRALLIDDQTAEFHLTLYGGSIYRFGACSGLTNGNLIFRVFDEDRNEIFTNENHNLSAYWDFKVESTLDIIVEGNLNLEKAQSGCAVLLVGFKP